MRVKGREVKAGSVQEVGLVLVFEGQTEFEELEGRGEILKVSRVSENTGLAMGEGITAGDSG